MGTRQLMAWPRDIDTKVIGFMAGGKILVVRVVWIGVSSKQHMCQAVSSVTGSMEFLSRRQHSMLA